MSKFEHAFRELLDSLSQATLAVVRADGNTHGGCQHHEGKQDMQGTVQGLFA